MHPAKRIAYNTLFLYGRMLVTIGVSLYSVRLVLNALGAEEYGLFQLVGGVVSMLSFLNSAMAASVQRNLSFALGRNDAALEGAVFNAARRLHRRLACVLVLLFEAVGVPAILYFLNLPEGREVSALVVLQSMILTTFLSVLSVPYDALAIAREEMGFLSLTGILEALFKLLTALLLLRFGGDRLLFYAGLTAAGSVAVRLLKTVYCRYRYVAARSKERPSRELIRSMTGFAGWDLLGNLSLICKDQGNALLLNHFFGVAINGAFGIAGQIGSHLTFFSATLMNAMRPRVIQREGSGDRAGMLRLAGDAGRYSSLLLCLVCVPAVMEMPALLGGWLGDVPPWTVVFCRLILIREMIKQLTSGVIAAVHAIGIIREFQLVVSFLVMFNLPLAYLFLRAGHAPGTVVALSVACELLAMCGRLYVLRRYAGAGMLRYAREVFLPVAAVPATVLPLLYLYKRWAPPVSGWPDTLAALLLAAALMLFFSLLWGITPRERALLAGYVRGRIPFMNP